MSVSARGLFRATGKKSKPVAVRDLMSGEIVRAEHLEREAEDFYPTPPEPTRALLMAEAERLRDFFAIWEPACGDGAMVREIQSAGHLCKTSDIVQRGQAQIVRDFYDFGKPLAPAIVTNPPFCEVNWRDGRGRWLTHALDVLGVEYMALILPWNWPGAAGMAGLWHRIPPARVYLMRWRIDFTGQGTPPMLNAWFVWDRAWRGETVLRMLDRGDDARQGGLL
jgi:hypothetical protein